MSRTKVVSREDIVKGRKTNDGLFEEGAFGPVKEKILDVVGEVLGGVKESLEAELSGIGLMVMEAVMNLEIERIAGKKGAHQGKGRQYNWWGTNPGSVVLDGQRVRCQIPRAVEVGTRKAYELKSHGLFTRGGELIRKAYRDLIRGVSTRRYREGVGEFLEGYGASASAVSRRMIKATTRKVEELLNRDLKDVELAVLMIDGLRVGQEMVVVALGIDTKGFKHVLGLWQGSTENARVAKNLLSDMVRRNLDIDRSLLVVIDGSKALRSAITEVLGKETLVQRCIEHKKRNVLEHLSKQDQPRVLARMTEAYKNDSAKDARAMLERLAQELEHVNPSAARSLREGLSETLMLQELVVPKELRQRLQSTNMIESTISGVRQRTRNVKRWPDKGVRSPKGDQVERWIGAGLLEVEKHFRRIDAYGALPILIEALTRRRQERNIAA